MSGSLMIHLEKRNIYMNKGNWFWHSKLMNWVEGKLLDVTNWVWKKRHITSNYTKPAGKVPAATPVKRAPRKTPAKKTEWTAK